MHGEIVLVTGANSGIGFETSRQLALLGAEVIMVCRAAERGHQAQIRVAEAALGPAPALLIADLASQASIRALSDQVHSRYGRIDVLINNAGAIFAHRELTFDGIEKTFAINHLAPFLLTQLLLDLVCAAPAGRVVTVASEIHSASLDFNNLQGELHYNFLSAYYRSKLENILFTYELARRVENSSVTVNSLSPGPTATRFGDNLRGLPGLFPALMKRIPYLFVDPAKGARTSVYLASSLDVAGVSGRFFMKCRETRTKPITYDASVARRLWDISEELTADDINSHVTTHELMALLPHAQIMEQHSR